MNRYIRTKDGRIAEIKNNMFVIQSDVLRLVYKDRPYICVLNGDDEIFKQADTIEELCDLFVAFQTNHIFDIMSNFNAFKKQYKNKEEIVCYGAIWTDKGLIYVAKVNDKGELELL